MEDVYRTVHWQNLQKQREKMAALTESEKAERFDDEEYIRRVKMEANRDALGRGLTRSARRREVYAAIQRAKKQIASREDS